MRLLIGRYARGDAAAFDALYRRHEMRIWRYLVRNVGNQATAEELTQEVWFAVAREAPRYRAVRAIHDLAVHHRAQSDDRLDPHEPSAHELGYPGI